MNIKNYQKIKTFWSLLLVITIFVLMSACVASDKPTTNNAEPSPADRLTKKTSPKESATPTTAVTENQSNTEQVYKASDLNNTVTFNSLGKVKVGMTVPDASKAIGTELVRGEGYDDACYYVTAKQGFKDVLFMITDGAISRIDIKSKAYATDKGAKIGDSEAKIKSLYQGVKVLPNKYDEKKHDLEVYSGDKKYLIIFETDGNLVTGFRTGKAEQVGYVEGCS